MNTKEILEDALIELSHAISKLEDSAPDMKSLLEAKRTFLNGMLAQLDRELLILLSEYDSYESQMIEEQQAIESFEKSWRTYNSVMKSIFKH